MLRGVAREDQVLEHADELLGMTAQVDDDGGGRLADLDHEGEGADEDAVAAVGEERGDALEVVLEEVRALADDAEEGEAGLLAYVLVVASEQLLHLAGQVAAHVGAADIPEGAQGLANNELIRVIQVVLQ